MATSERTTETEHAGKLSRVRGPGGITTERPASDANPHDATWAGRWAAWLAAGALLGFLVLPLAAIVHRAWSEAGETTSDTWDVLRDALSLSLWTTAVSLAVIIVFGTPLAWMMARRHFRGKAVVETLIDLPMVLPPAVAGLALLMAFGRRGLVGETLDGWGITIGFSSIAVIMAQIFVASPFFVRSARAGFARSDHALEEAAADLGASPARVLRTISLPLARSSLAAGSVLAWARAVGEFGATIIFAGSIAGRTQTMPLAIYGRYEAGDLETALVLAVILLGVSMLVLLAVRMTGGGRLR